MADAETYNYSTPVAQLLTYGKPEVVEVKDWPNYLELGLKAEHIPDLIRLATDERWNDDNSESRESWAPYHAWRALGQLRAEGAAEPLLSLYKTQEDSEWVMEELPEVYGLIGPAALPVLTAFISDRSNGEWPRINATASVEKIGLGSPDARSLSIEILSKQMEAFQETEYEFNAFLITSLIKLEAKEAAPLIERAFAADAVEIGIVGEWEDVQEALGLFSPEELEVFHQRREIERRQRQGAFNKVMGIKLAPVATPSDTYWRQPSGTPAFKKAKHKNKMAKQSRKKNRKR